MSVISWILLILFLLVAGSGIAILIVGLFIEDPNIIFPDSGILLPENGGLIYTAELCPTLRRIEKVALTGIKQLVAVMIAVLLLYLLFKFSFLFVGH